MAVERLGVEFRLSAHKRVQALDDVSFELHRGEVLGVVGESGSGKSTLGRVVAGFLRPDRGRVLFRGGSGSGILREQEGRTRGSRPVQMIFQESAAALNPRLTVRKLVAEAFSPNSFLGGGRNAAALEERVRHQLFSVGLSESYLNRRAAELSGGQKQRVAIARAMAAEPMAIVCDESVSALDVSVRAVVLNLFERLAAETGTALLFISHDISVVAHMAHRVLVMSGGRVVESGPTRQIIEYPADPYTRSLIDAVPTLERDAGPDDTARQTTDTTTSPRSST